jgi:hypothetical protein
MSICRRRGLFDLPGDVAHVCAGQIFIKRAKPQVQALSTEAGLIAQAGRRPAQGR